MATNKPSLASRGRQPAAKPSICVEINDSGTKQMGNKAGTGLQAFHVLHSFGFEWSCPSIASATMRRWIFPVGVFGIELVKKT